MSKIATFADAEMTLRGLKQTPLKRRLQSPETMLALMDFLNHPQEQYPAVHVAGTSGKTSTAYYTAALLRAAGYKVGLTVSPHVDALNERVQINLVPLPEREFAAEFSVFWEGIQRSGLTPTYFETFIAFAFWEFARQQVDYAVVEVGIGGLADSTNVIRRADKVCVITDIGYGHRQILGNTLEEIAGQKAGIIQLHNAAFCFEQSPEIMQPIRARAEQKQADLHVLRYREGRQELAFLPLFQQRNFSLAEETARWLQQHNHKPALSAEAVLSAARTKIPGRMEVYSVGGKTVVIDAAHNVQKFQALIASVHAAFPGQPIALLLGLLKEPDHFVREMVQSAGAIGHVITTGWPADFAGKYASTDPAAVATAGQGAGEFEVVPEAERAFAALLKRPEPVLVATGSFYLLNHVRPLLDASL